MVTYRPPRLAQPLAEPELSAACHAWQHGGCQALSLWGARHLAYWTVRSYGELVTQVREALGDTTDYQLVNEEDHAMPDL